MFVPGFIKQPKVTGKTYLHKITGEMFQTGFCGNELFLYKLLILTLSTCLSGFIKQPKVTGKRSQKKNSCEHYRKHLKIFGRAAEIRQKQANVTMRT